MTSFQVVDAAGFLKSLSQLSVQDSQPEEYSCASISGSRQSLPMEQLLSIMPKHKLSRNDFMNEEFTKLKENADHEASPAS